MSFVYFEHPLTIISETQLNGQVGFVGQFTLNEEQKKYGVWNGDSVVVSQRKKEIIQRTESETLEGRKVQKVNELKKKLETVFESGFSHEGKVYHSDSNALIQISSALAGLSAGAEFPNGYTWGTKSGERITFTEEQFKTFAISFLTFYDQKIKSVKVKQNAINSLSTIQSVLEYQIGEL